MDKNKTNEVIEILNKIMEYELSGVVRYTHYALMITGRDRISLAQFFKDQASESLLHAQEAGEIVTGLKGHPSVKISIIEESNKHFHNPIFDYVGDSIKDLYIWEKSRHVLVVDHGNIINRISHLNYKVISKRYRYT